jgi:hypothetical protein
MMSAAELILATGSAPAAPATGRVTLYAGTDNKLYLKDAAGTAEQVGTGGASAPYLWRNALLNGGFALWQRQNDPATATEYGDDAYCADRWYVLTQSGPIDAQRIDGSAQRYAARLTQKQTTAQQIGLAQIIEGVNCRHLRGQSVTLSARVRCSAACTARIAVLEWAGGEDSVTSDVVADWANWTLAANVSAPGAIVSTSLNAAAWAELEQTVTLGNTFTNLIVFVWTSALDTSATLDLEALQLERGSAVTPFEVRPVGGELALCQRYYQVFHPGNAYFVAYAWAGLNSIYVQTVPLHVEMRVAPGVTDTNPSWSAGFPGTDNAASFYPPGSPPYVTTTGTFDISYGASVSTLYMEYKSSHDDFAGCAAGDVGRATFGTAYRAYLDAEL